MAAVLTAVIYLGLSNYCLTYAVATGKSHCLPAPIDQAQPHGDHGHDADHDDSSDHHGHSPSDSGPCCAKVSELTVPSGPQLLASAALTSFVFLHLIAAEDSVASERCFRQADHGPPKTAAQEVSLASRAPRAPPAIA